jgi:hypothetical protein
MSQSIKNLTAELAATKEKIPTSTLDSTASKAKWEQTHHPNPPASIN